MAGLKPFRVLATPSTAHKGPFTLSIVPIALKAKTRRQKFTCGYKAMEALRGLKLDPAKYYGADVCDDNGVKLGEVGE